MATAVISTTADDKYYWYLPLTVWAWNKIGYGVVCFIPIDKSPLLSAKSALIDKTLSLIDAKLRIEQFDAEEHKAATYCQVSRLLACCLNLPEKEQLVVSDIDMLFLSKDYIQPAGWA